MDPVRPRRRAWLLSIALAGCAGPQPPQEAELSPLTVVELPEGPAPHDAPGFLRLVDPLPFAEATIVYDVKGPAGLTGTYEALLRRGGFRRYNWALRLDAVEGSSLSIEGSMIRTPDRQWTTGEGAESGASQLELGGLARAFERLPRDQQVSIARRIRQWQASVVGEQDPRLSNSFAGQACSVTSIGAHRLCVWDVVGELLAYESQDFKVVARHIERDAELGATAFEIPARPPRSPQVTADPDLRLQRVADGDNTVLASVLRAGGPFEPLRQSSSSAVAKP